ncbi:hypothetical protein AAC387_Pa03g4431 [Persea americana]
MEFEQDLVCTGIREEDRRGSGLIAFICAVEKAAGLLLCRRKQVAWVRFLQRHRAKPGSLSADIVVGVTVSDLRHPPPETEGRACHGCCLSSDFLPLAWFD